MHIFPYADGLTSKCDDLPPRGGLTGAVRKHYKSIGNDRHSVSRQTSKKEMGADLDPWTFSDHPPAWPR